LELIARKIRIKKKQEGKKGKREERKKIEGREEKGIHTRKQEVKLLLCKDNMVLYVEDPKDSIKTY
jgi:hypothetical protein